MAGVKASWRRAKKLAALAGISPAQARNFLARHSEYTAVLDGNENKDSAKVKDLISFARRSVGVTAAKARAKQAAPYAVLQRIRDLATEMGGLSHLRDGIRQLESIQLT